MNDPKETEVVEETEEIVEEVEEEIPDEEILEAIDDELTGDPEATADPEPEPEPEAKKDDEPEAKPEEPVEAVPEAEPEKPAEEAKPSDEFGTLEEGTPEKTRERFETLKVRYDDVVAERDKAVTERETWAQVIKDTGTNEEQFGMALTWLTKVNSGKPEDLQEAYAIMSGELDALGKMLGKPSLNGPSPLDAHPDLKQRVDDGMLDEKDALEIVEARATKNLNQTHTEATTAQEQHQAKVQSAIKDIENIGVQMKQKDPVYFDGKMKLLEPMIDGIIKSAPNAPETWAAAIQEAYNRLPNIPAAPAPKPATPESIRPTPTSPSSVPMDKEPGSAVEAIDLALSRGY